MIALQVQNEEKLAALETAMRAERVSDKTGEKYASVFHVSPRMNPCAGHKIEHRSEKHGRVNLEDPGRTR